MGFGHLLFLGFSVYAFKFKSAKQKKKRFMKVNFTFV